MTHRIGMLVNPVAGMGGSVGLKGTDGDAYRRALELGARPVTPGRARDFLRRIGDAEEVDFLAAPGPMGADHFAAEGVPCRVVGNAGGRTTREDTLWVLETMLDEGIELLVFTGGDGTARDVAEVLAPEGPPVVGIPSGVKIFSPVFALGVRAAAGMFRAFLQGAPTRQEEVLDIDEEAFRDNRLSSTVCGALSVPDVQHFLQGGKRASSPSIRRLASFRFPERPPERFFGRRAPGDVSLAVL